MQKKWTPEEIQHLKDINPIAIVAGELGLQVVKGRARCIFPENHSHGDRTPSMSINSNSGSFKCWVCDAVYGDVIKLVMLVKRCNFVDALGWLNERTPVHSITADLKTGPISQKTHATIHFDMDLEYRSAIILDFLKLLKPVDGQALKYLNSRKIFKITADAQKLRMIDDYDRVNRALQKLYPMKDLQEYGFYSDTKHLRFYKHPLIFPYVNKEGIPLYFQARAIEAGVTPKELNVKGPIPLPYNARLLNQKPGVVFLCEGIIDTLTMIAKSFDAVGVPGVNSFKNEWFDLFRHKNVFIAFDADEAGKKGAEKLHEAFTERNISSSIITLPEGEDINQFFTS